MTLSILVPTIESRKEVFSDLICDLIKQCGVIKKIDSTTQQGCVVLKFTFDKVEIITACDAKQLPTGSKRQMLLGLSKHTHIVFVDCDDYVYPYYISEMLKGIESDPDCVAINGIYSVDGKSEMQWFLAKDNPNDTVKVNGKDVYRRTTNHITAVRRTIALLAGFPPLYNKEDSEYSARINKYLKSEVTLSLPMYHYRYNSKIREY